MSVLGRLWHSEYVYIDYLPLPPSDNERVHWRKAYEKLKLYKEEVGVVLLASANTSLPLPPVILLYKCYLNRASRDAQNCQKALVDALYRQDKEAYPWCLPPEVDKKNPRVEVWLIKI